MESRKVSVLPCKKAFGGRYDCECACDRLGRGKGAAKQREEISLVHRVYTRILRRRMKVQRILSTCHHLPSRDESAESAAFSSITEDVRAVQSVLVVVDVSQYIDES